MNDQLLHFVGRTARDLFRENAQKLPGNRSTFSDSNDVIAVCSFICFCPSRWCEWHKWQP